MGAFVPVTILLLLGLQLVMIIDPCAAAVVVEFFGGANCSGSSSLHETYDQNKCIAVNGQYYKYTCLDAAPGNCLFAASCSGSGFGLNGATPCETCVPSYGQYADYYKCDKKAGTYQRYFHYTKNCSGDSSAYSVETVVAGCVWNGQYPNNYNSKIDACPKKVVQQYYNDKDCTQASFSTNVNLADVCTGGGSWMYRCDTYDKPVVPTPPTTVKPTTAKPTTAKPTTPKPTTAKPTTRKPTTAKPTTAKPTTAKPTTAKPTTAKPTTRKPTTAKPTTAKPTTAKPTTAKPTTAKPTTAKPTTAKPTTPKRR